MYYIYKEIYIYRVIIYIKFNTFIEDPKGKTVLHTMVHLSVGSVFLDAFQEGNF